MWMRIVVVSLLSYSLVSVAAPHKAEGVQGKELAQIDWLLGDWQCHLSSGTTEKGEKVEPFSGRLRVTSDLKGKWLTSRLDATNGGTVALGHFGFSATEHKLVMIFLN